MAVKTKSNVGWSCFTPGLHSSNVVQMEHKIPI